jgi:hypothetical protein
MEIGTIVDWIERIFGIAFVLFMLSVLIFPSWRERPESLSEPRADQEEPARLTEPDPDPVGDRGYAKLLIFPDHRRVQR